MAVATNLPIFMLISRKLDVPNIKLVLLTMVAHQCLQYNPICFFLITFDDLLLLFYPTKICTHAPCSDLVLRRKKLGVIYPFLLIRFLVGSSRAMFLDSSIEKILFFNGIKDLVPTFYEIKNLITTKGVYLLVMGMITDLLI
jgi:hypothetical protein